MAATQYNATVQKAYIAYYGRPADPSGLAYWTDKLAAAKGNLSEIIQAFGSSAEATSLFGSKTNLAAVETLYQQIFGRGADSEGLIYYSGELQAGRMTLVNVAQRIIDGAKGGDVAIVSNRLVAAQSFTDSLNTGPEILAYQGDAAAASARTWLSSVSSTAGSLTTATAAIDATISTIIANYGGGSSGGSTFTLTTSSRDIYNGTSGNNDVSGLFSSDDTKNTADATDTIFDAYKTDSDTFTVTTDDDVDDNNGYTLPSLTNIENLVVKVDATTTPAGTGTTFELDVTDAVGVKSISVDVVRAVSGITQATITGIDDGVTVSTGTKLKVIDVTSKDEGEDINVNASSVGTEGSPVEITIGGNAGVVGDNVITAAGHADVTTDSDGAVTVTANKSLVLDASAAAVVIATAKDGALEVDAAAAVSASLTASGNVTVTDGGDGALEINSTSGNVTVDDANSTETNISADGDVSFDGANSGDMTITSGGDVTVGANTASEATDVSISATGAVDYTGTVGNGDITITAGDEVTLTSDHTSVTVASIGSSTLDIDSAESLSVSGNGDDAEYDVTEMSALESITATGKNDVTLVLDSADISGNKLTIKDESSGSLTVELDTAGSVDMRGSDLIDSLAINDDFAGETLSLRSGQSLTVATSQGNTEFEIGTASAVAKNTVTLVLNDGSRDANVVDLDGVAVTNARTITIDASGDLAAGSLANPSTITDFDASAAKANVTIKAGANGVKLDDSFDVGTGTLTITSSGAVDLQDTVITASIVDASAVTGKVSATDLSAEAQIVKTGTGNDSLEYDGGVAGSFTVESGAGNDTLKVDGVDYSNLSVSLNLGDGTADTLVLQTGTVLSKGTTGSVTLAGVEVIRAEANATVDAALLTGQTYAMHSGNGTTAATVTLTAAVASSASTLDFTKLVASTETATKFTGATFKVDASANTSAITIQGMTKVANSIEGSAAKGDSLVGGDLNDTFTYDNSNLLFADKAMLDTVVGGAGTADTITVTAGNIAATDSWANISGVERFTGGGASLAFGATAETAGLKTFVVTMAADTTISTAAYTTTATSITASGAFAATITTGAGGGSVTVAVDDEHVITGGSGADTITVGTATGTAGQVVSSGAGNDSVTTGGGDDDVSAGDGNDSINGRGGDDTLSGGANDDTFTFTVGDVAATNNLADADEVDGGTGNDTIRIVGEDTMRMM